MGDGGTGRLSDLDSECAKDGAVEISGSPDPTAGATFICVAVALFWIMRALRRYALNLNKEFDCMVNRVLTNQDKLAVYP